MDVVDPRPLLAPLISFTCAGLVFAVGDNVFWRRFWSLSAAAVKLVLILSMLPGTLRGVVYTFDVVTFTPGVEIAFRADAYGMFFALVSSTLWLLTTVYAIGYMQGEHDRVRFFGFFALCVSTTVGVAFAENLLTFFLFYETLTICTYPLVVHAETREALQAGRVYLTYTLIGGGFALVGAVMTFDAAGTLTLSRPGVLGLDMGVGTLALIFVCLIVGFGVKAAIMPLHGWLPIAMVAPTPVSALLHAVAVVKVGAFGVTRVIYNVFGVDLLGELGFATPLAWLAAFTIVAASVIALTQDHLKRRLAYSTISQLSYIILGAALLTPLAATAAIAHVAHQAFAKITMFFVAGAIARTTGKRHVSELAGIGAQMPWTMAAFSLAALSFVGVPLLAGFITKWYLSLGALEAGAWWFVVVMIVSSLLNAAYWFPILHLAYFRTPAGAPLARREAAPTLLVPTLIAAAFVLLLGVTAETNGMPFSVARVAVVQLFGGPGAGP
jgi:multicomponent Na+:H+ antiporter subunit D